MCHCRLIISFVLIFFCATRIKAQQPFNYPFRHINQSGTLLYNEVLSNGIVMDVAKRKKSEFLKAIGY